MINQVGAKLCKHGRQFCAECHMPDNIESFKQRADRLHRDFVRELKRLKAEDPEKYQELMDAEQTIFKSYREHQLSI